MLRVGGDLASPSPSHVGLSPIMVLEALRSVSLFIPQASIPPAAAAVVDALASLPVPVAPPLAPPPLMAQVVAPPASSGKLPSPRSSVSPRVPSNVIISPIHAPLSLSVPPVPALRRGTQSSTPPPRRRCPAVRPGVAAANALVAREDGPAFRARAARVSAAWSGADRTATITAAEFRRHLLSYREGAQMEDLVE